jgi:hypothetical protein
MKKLRILIAGDSFAADWQVKYPEKQGWPNWLAEKFSVTNVAQAGAGEYKILQQLKRVELSNFDCVIISHASPNRVYCTQHPIHENDPLHKNSDIIYADIKEHSENSDAVLAAKYYERYFDFDYYNDISKMCCSEILNILGNYFLLDQYHIVNYNSKQKYDCLPETLNINEIFSKHPGSTNHFDDTGNRLLYEKLCSLINY